jgi:DNA-directed RNA polymerase subunit M
MPWWTCPNAKCTYDKQLEAGQHCPLCGEQAKEFKSSELGNLWKQKWDFKKSIERARKQEEVLARRKFCPKCGSPNVNFLVFYRPSIWRCLECGYEGAFIVEDSRLAEKIGKRHLKK